MTVPDKTSPEEVVCLRSDTLSSRVQSRTSSILSKPVLMLNSGGRIRISNLDSKKRKKRRTHEVIVQIDEDLKPGDPNRSC